jgi:hypothetical protein
MKNLIVIDDFYKNPQSVRQYALRASYLDSRAVPEEFPGVESQQCFYSQSVVEKIEQAVGYRIKFAPKGNAFGGFVKSYAKEEACRAVHVGRTDWMAIVYLCNSKDERGGTVFFRDRATGLDGIPCDEKLAQAGYRDRDDFKDRFLKPRALSIGDWVITSRVVPRYNRMVLFRAGQLFHSADGHWGTTEETCRLLQVFFFNAEAAV